MHLRTMICAFGVLVASPASASAFLVNFKWCGSGSPTFSLVGVPSGTAKLSFNMTDLNVPNYEHGGGTVTYSGQQTVPCGALDNYVGPSPPNGPHTYRFAVTALDAKGGTLGTATATRQFPEK